MLLTLFTASILSIPVPPLQTDSTGHPRALRHGDGLDDCAQVRKEREEGRKRGTKQ